MAKITLTSITISVIIMIFIVISGGSLMVSMQEKYGVTSTTSDLSTDLTTYNEMEGRYSTFADDLEDTVEGTEASDTDDESTSEAQSGISKFLSIRDDIRDTQSKSRNILWFVPDRFWILVLTIIGIIIAALIVGLFWRYKEGLH